MTKFAYNPGSGITISSANWDFGDGSSSTNISPQYIYKTTGKFLITLTATLSNSNQITDTTYIEVVPLPTANFPMLSSTDTCFYGNQVCFQDLSTPGKSGQDIVTRLVVWGDGAFNNKSNPVSGESFCHTYAMVDKYTIKIEITDIYGCKATKTRPINILDQTNAGFNYTNTFKDCNSKNICFRNQSSGKLNSSAKYLWNITGQAPDSNQHFSNFKCYNYTSNQSGTIKLKVTDVNGCKDSVTINFDVKIDALPTKFTITDTLECYSTDNVITASTTQCEYDQEEWTVNSTKLSLVKGTSLAFKPKNLGMKPGINTVTLKLIRGNCTTTYSARVHILGPMVSFKIYDNNQCFSSRKVTMVSTTKFGNQNAFKYEWTINDINGGKCTTDRKNSKNLNGNCNFSTDKFHDHNFKYPPKTYNVRLIVKDTITGCIDSSTSSVVSRDCNILVDLDSLTLCEGKKFEVIPDYKNPKYVSFDSGKSWRTFPAYPPAGLKGKVDIGLIYQTILTEWVEHVSKDSIRIRKDTLILYDTLYKKNFLRIASLNTDSVKFFQYSTCNEHSVSIKFKQGVFYHNQLIQVDWGNGYKYYRLVTEDSIILDSIHNKYFGSAVNCLVTVTISNNYGCEWSDRFVARAGKSYSNGLNNRYFCKPQKLCLYPRVVDFNLNRAYTNSEINQYVKIVFSDTTVIGNSIVCYDFKKPGYNVFTTYVNNRFNCIDTIVDSVFIQNLRADVANGTRTIYCNELKQFFDSSTLLKYPNEYINYYNWDFGSGKFTNPVKNPFRSLNTSAKEIYVTHCISTALGCKDTIVFKLNIVGSHPYFRIVDTIACGSLEAVFKNLSENCSGYIWELGDDNGTIIPMSDKSDVKFTYAKPGRYHIKLNGYDSIYNPSTQSTYFCNALFPDPNFHKDSIRDVIILPISTSGIKSIDTICPGRIIQFTSETDKSFAFDKWIFDNDSIINAKVNDTILYTWDKPGTYNVKLVPSYKNESYNICSDSAEKQIVVINVKADFKIDSVVHMPSFKFKNLSVPLSANMYWDFGDKNSSYNNSREVHPLHKYGYDTGTYNVCLIASTNYGCADTICKPISNTYLVELLVFNVFTPGNNDSYNDRYDVLIEGEDKYHLRIYNRWGVLVYEGFKDSDNTTDINWNGKVFNKGVDCPAGTYYYIFDYTLKDDPNKYETINGTVTLIRN